MFPNIIVYSLFCLGGSLQKALTFETPSLKFISLSPDLIEGRIVSYMDPESLANYALTHKESLEQVRNERIRRTKIKQWKMDLSNDIQPYQVFSTFSPIYNCKLCYLTAKELNPDREIARIRKSLKMRKANAKKLFTYLKQAKVINYPIQSLELKIDNAQQLNNILPYCTTVRSLEIKFFPQNQCFPSELLENLPGSTQLSSLKIAIPNLTYSQKIAVTDYLFNSRKFPSLKRVSF